MKASSSSAPTDKNAPTARRRPGQQVSCGWCGTEVPVPARGRVPKWCSSSCRHRAWEQRRAAEAGLAAVKVVDRPVEVIVEKTTVIERRPPCPCGRVRARRGSGPRCWTAWSGPCERAGWTWRTWPRSSRPSLES